MLKDIPAPTKNFYHISHFCDLWKTGAEHNMDFSAKGKFTITVLTHCINLFTCEPLQQMLF